MILGDCDSNFVFINALQYRPMHIILEQFTVKAHLALFGWEGEGGRVKKGGTLLFQYTFNIHIQNSKNNTKKHNFEQSVGDHQQKC